MDQNTKPLITSFILRFVQDQPGRDVEVHPYRGAIRHIQSDKEVQFAHWKDAEEFIRQFVSLDQPHGKVETK